MLVLPGWKFRVDLTQGHRKKTNNAQTIKGNWQRRAGSLITVRLAAHVSNG